ncbi:MAG: nucleotide exchange factor GrpE [Patescibacteria group bacterium]
MTEDEKLKTEDSTQASVPPDPSVESVPSDLQAQCAEYLAGWKRALADYENLQKMNAQTRDTDRRRVRSSLAEELLPVIDNFGYVMKHVPSLEGCSDEFKKTFDTWVQGIGHIDRQFAEALKGMGVEPIATVGQKFDPNLHESGGSKQDESKPDGEVLDEVIKGWKLGDVVLRPAKVIVNEKIITK